jgi:hypothetical protein
MGPSGFTSYPKKGVPRNFIVLKNPSPWPVSTWKLDSSGKHTNHYTTEATSGLVLHEITDQPATFISIALT